jgi:hypothetical protein
MNIQDDKYFDFVYYLDFIKIIEYYVNNIDNQEILPKTINISYDKKYKLSEIAKLISPNIKLNISIENSKNNYSGNPEKLNDFKLNFIGLENSIEHYRQLL